MLIQTSQARSSWCKSLSLARINPLPINLVIQIGATHCKQPQNLQISIHIDLSSAHSVPIVRVSTFS